MTPVATLTPEIFARISPTIIDLFIALVWGIIAFLSLWFKKLWEGVAGVAMATALIPPLCVTGVGISFLSMEITKGSFLLFLTNFVTIVFVWIVIFYAFGFFATNKKGKKHSIESIFLTIITIILILTPLTQSMRNIADDIKTKQTIENVSNKFLANINKWIEIEKTSYQIQDNDTLRISTTIAVPSATPITEKHKNELSQILALATQKSVNLDINIVNVSSVLIEKKEEITKDQQLQRKIEEYIKTYTGITIIESKIAYNPAPLVYINLFSERENIKGKIENNTELLSKEILGTGTKTLILRQQINGDQEQKEKIAYYQEIETYIKEKLPTNIYIENITIEKKVNEEEEFFLVNIKIKSSLWAKEVQNTLKNIQQKLEGTYPNQFKIQASVVPLNEIYLP